MARLYYGNEQIKSRKGELPTTAWFRKAFYLSAVLNLVLFAALLVELLNG